MTFQVTLNDSRLVASPGTSVSYGFWTEPTVVTVQAESARVTEAGELIFRGTRPGRDIECFARGTWTRWKIEE